MFIEFGFKRGTVAAGITAKTQIQALTQNLGCFLNCLVALLTGGGVSRAPTSGSIRAAGWGLQGIQPNDRATERRLTVSYERPRTLGKQGTVTSKGPVLAGSARDVWL